MKEGEETSAEKRKVVEMGNITLGSRDEATHPESIRAAFGEFILTFLFVFAGVGAAMAAATLEGGGGIAGLTAVAAAHALVVAVIVSAGLHLSGAHINPSVTLGLLVSGRISVIRSVIYVIAQLLGSYLACLLLRYITGGLVTPVHTLGNGVGAIQGLVMEVVLTFSLIFTVYATIVDGRKMIPDGLGPLLVGLVVGANILAGGPFSGASMNPARSFGPALATWNWTDHWIYWVGPPIGGAIAGLVYDTFFLVENTHEPLPSSEGF